MDIKILPRETVVVAKNYQSLIDWYIDNLKYFKSIEKKEHVKRIGLKV